MEIETKDKSDSISLELNECDSDKISYYEKLIKNDKSDNLRKTTKILFFKSLIKNIPIPEDVYKITHELEKCINFNNKALFESFKRTNYIKKTKSLINNLNKNKIICEKLINQSILPEEILQMDEKVLIL